MNLSPPAILSQAAGSLSPQSDSLCRAALSQVFLSPSTKRAVSMLSANSSEPDKAPHILHLSILFSLLAQLDILKQFKHVGQKGRQMLNALIAPRNLWLSHGDVTAPLAHRARWRQVQLNQAQCCSAPCTVPWNPCCPFIPITVGFWKHWASGSKVWSRAGKYNVPLLSSHAQSNIAETSGVRTQVKPEVSQDFQNKGYGRWIRNYFRLWPWVTAQSSSIFVNVCVWKMNNKAEKKNEQDRNICREKRPLSHKQEAQVNSEDVSTCPSITLELTVSVLCC